MDCSCFVQMNVTGDFGANLSSGKVPTVTHNITM